MSKKICIEVYIAGKVQGVWFRASTQTEAKKLGLTGYALNLSDGRVKVVTCGDEEKVMQLFTWLKKGPELARVDDIKMNRIEAENFDDFEVIREI